MEAKAPQELATEWKTRWEGHDIPFALVAARFNILWDDPIGQGGYARVLEVIAFGKVLTMKVIDRATGNVGIAMALLICRNMR